MRTFLTPRRFLVPLAVVSVSLGVMGAQCQPTKPAPTPAPRLQISPSEHDFGNESADGASTNFFLFNVTNDGSAPTGRLDSVTVGGGASGAFDATHPSAPGAPGGACPGAVLAPGESCRQQVFFNPTAGFAGALQTTLVVVGDPGGTVTARLTGNAVP